MKTNTLFQTVPDSKKPVPKNYYDVVISGMGPAGLTAAWSALRTGKKVLMISNRPNKFIRTQKIYLDMHSRQILLAMAENSIMTQEDLKFLNNICSHSVIGIKDIERYIFARLKQSKNIEFAHEHELSEVDLQTGKAKYVPCSKIQEDKSVAKDLKTDEKSSAINIKPQEIEFTYLVSADGGNHHALNLANNSVKNINQKAAKPLIEPITHKPIDSMKKANWHFSVYITIECKSGANLNVEQENFIVSFERRTGCVYALAYDRPSHRKSRQKTIKCNVSGEIPLSVIPENISHLNNNPELKEKVWQYIQNTLQKHFQPNNSEDIQINLVKKSRKHGPEKDKIKFLTFKITAEKANKAYIKNQDKICLLVGDSYQSPNYQVGHGANTALRLSDFLVSVFSGKKSLEEYNELCEERAASAAKHSWTLNWTRSISHGAASSNLIQKADSVETETKSNLLSKNFNNMVEEAWGHQLLEAITKNKLSRATELIMYQQKNFPYLAPFYISELIDTALTKILSLKDKKNDDFYSLLLEFGYAHNINRIIHKESSLPAFIYSRSLITVFKTDQNSDVYKQVMHLFLNGGELTANHFLTIIQVLNKDDLTKKNCRTNFEAFLKLYQEKFSINEKKESNQAILKNFFSFDAKILEHLVKSNSIILSEKDIFSLLMDSRRGKQPAYFDALKLALYQIKEQKFPLHLEHNKQDFSFIFTHRNSIINSISDCKSIDEAYLASNNLVFIDDIIKKIFNQIISENGEPASILKYLSPAIDTAYYQISLCQKKEERQQVLDSFIINLKKMHPHIQQPFFQTNPIVILQKIINELEKPQQQPPESKTAKNDLIFLQINKGG